MKGKIILVGAIILALSVAGVVSAQDISTFIGSQGSAVMSFLNDQPPVIGEVVQEPAAPKSGEDMNITATVANDVEKTDETTIEAYLHYSSDEGKTWTEVELEQGEEDESKWTGVIPGQPGGTKVVYYISAFDTAGNLATEMPGLNTVWPPVAGKQEPLLAAPGKDDNDSETQVPNGADFLTLAAGYNEENLFIKVEVEGEITPGTTSPARMNAWAAAAVNTDRSEDLLKSGVALFYAPLIKGVFGSMAGITEDFAAIDERIAETYHVIPYAECGIDSVVIDKALYFKIKRSALGKNPSNMIKFIGASGTITAMDVSALTTGWAAYDATCWVAAYFKNHSYTVEE
ncbi:MAG: hypothetical protein COS84_06020 [Armatimonadetes bacterium CG07_land_8_20_14_0_80_40_9]|nr:MAG: hypothetical protein COS84_06020 [Armatimonadetes bacterium CG07_land_8_20_14_0_80_40_9]